MRKKYYNEEERRMRIRVRKMSKILSNILIFLFLSLFGKT